MIINLLKSHIYKRTIVATGKHYIGKHKGGNIRYKGSGIDYVKDLKKYVKNKTDIITEIVEYVEDVSKLNEREEYWLKLVDAANNPLYYNRTNKSYGVNVQSRKTKEKISNSTKLTWYKKRKEQGLIINEQYIKAFVKIFQNFNLTENNKHCINYCYNNNLLLNNIICPCNKGIKRFQNYTKGYKQYCSQKCSNTFTSVQSQITKEFKGIYNNSKKRLRQKEIQHLSQQEIKQLKSKRISEKLKGKKPYSPHTNGNTIIQLNTDGIKIQEFPSIRQAGKELANTSGETIRKCLKGLQKTAYGYKWKYKE